MLTFKPIVTVTCILRSLCVTERFKDKGYIIIYVYDFFGSIIILIVLNEVQHLNFRID